MSGRKHNPLNYLIPIIAVGVILIAASHFLLTTPKRPQNVWREEMVCLSAGCFKDSLGVESCIEFEPQVAKIVVSPEYAPSDPLRLTIVLMDKACTTGIKMPVLNTILLGDNPITFTISFLVNLILLWYLWSIVRPMKDENIKLKEKLDSKDEVISELTKDNKEMLIQVMSKLVALSGSIEDSAKLVGEYSALLAKMYDRTKAMQEDGKFCKEELRDIERTLTNIANSVENINTKQTITQSLLFPLQGMGHDNVTKVK